MSFRSRLLPFLPFFGVFLLPQAAHAEPTPSQIASAREAFEAAVSLEGAHHWPEAARKLQEAIAVKDTPGLRFHLGHCESEQGLLVEAAADYERASGLLAHGASAPDVEKLLASASAELKQRTPRVTLEIPAQAALTAIRIDDKPVAESDITQGLNLNPGRHRVLVSATARRDFQRAFSLVEGDAVVIRAVLPLLAGEPAQASPAGPAAPGPQPVNAPPRLIAVSEQPPAPRGNSTKLYLMIGESALTVAGLAVGVGFQLSASSATDRVGSAQQRIDQASMNSTRACSSVDATVQSACADLRSAITDHDHAVTLSTIGFIGAGVGAAALVTTWLAYPSSQPSNSGVSVRPALGWGRAGIVGRF